MVHAVDRDRVGVERGSQARSRRELDAVSKVVALEPVVREVVVLERVRVLGLEVLVERSAQRDVDDLEPSAEPENRLVVLDRPLHELKLDAVARRIDPSETRMRRLTERGGVDVDSARDQNAVQPLVDSPKRIELVDQRNEHRRCASRRHSLEIALIHDDRMRQTFGNAVDGLERLCRYADQRTVDHSAGDWKRIKGIKGSESLKAAGQEDHKFSTTL